MQWARWSPSERLPDDHGFCFLLWFAGGSSTGVILRRHGDEVSRLAGGVYCAQGRCDDTMNLGGIKVTYSASLMHLMDLPSACVFGGLSALLMADTALKREFAIASC